MYCTQNFPTKRALREAVARGERVTLFAPGLGTPKEFGPEYVEGPHFPQPHRWAAKVEMSNGVVVRVE